LLTLSALGETLESEFIILYISIYFIIFNAGLYLEITCAL
jgi:hypothetical protein